MPRLPVRLALSSAGSTHTSRPTAARLGDAQVRTAERMSVDACRLSRSLRSETLAAQDVHAVRDHFEVLGVYAPAIAAEMIENEPVRDRPAHELVADAMRPTAAKLAIALLGQALTAARSLPWPASRTECRVHRAVLAHQRPERLDERTGRAANFSHGPTPTPLRGAHRGRSLRPDRRRSARRTRRSPRSRRANDRTPRRRGDARTRRGTSSRRRSGQRR